MKIVDVPLGNGVVPCQVTGGPAGVTAVLLHGTGLDAGSWTAVQDGLEGTVRSVAYSRKDLTSALGARGPLTAVQLAGHLRLLLGAGGFVGPYVLVGHSWGAAVARAFAGASPDVPALVLVDGTHEELTGLRSPLFRLARAGASLASQLLPLSPAQELAGVQRSLRTLPEPAVPVWAVTGGRASNHRQRRVRDDFARVYARHAAFHVIAPTAGHHVPVDAPEVVVTTIVHAATSLALVLP